MYIINKVNIYILAFLIFLLFPISHSKADDLLCLEKTGFVYPIFDGDKCDSDNDTKITRAEFLKIIDIKKDQRRQEIEKIRANLINLDKEIEAIKKTEDNVIPKIESGDERKKLAKIKKQEQEDQKKIRKLKRKAELKKRKEEIKRKKLAKKKELENKKIARKKELENKKLARIAKQEKIKKEKKLKNIERKLRIEKKRQELEEKRLAKKKDKDFLKKQKNKKSFFQKSTIPDEEINNELKIIYINNNIIKKEILPEINTASQNFEIIEEINLEKINKLIAYNSNLLFIIPKDIDLSSNVTKESQINSRYLAGTKSVPNPDFNRLQMEIRNTESKYRRAREQEQYFFYQGQNSGTYSWADLLIQGANVAAQLEWGNRADDLQSNLNNLINKYSNTPEYIEKEVFRNYNYIVQDVVGEKKAIYKILGIKNEKLTKQNIYINKLENFKLAYNVDAQDKNYEKLINKYHTTNDITLWQNKRLANVSVEDILKKIQNDDTTTVIESKKDFYSDLGLEFQERKSIFGNLFKSNKEKKVSKIDNSRNFEIKDERFISVVIIKTESGLGSGFFINKNEILTNYHVVENAMNITVINKNKKKSSAIIIKKDLKRDLAILKTNMTGKPVEFFDGKIKQGEMVEALGHPKGRKFSLTKGWVSAIRKESSVYNATGIPDVLYIQTDAAINSGNSGGPLYYNNKVIGVNTQKLSGESIEGMNFAVHFSEVKRFISSN